MTATSGLTEDEIRKMIDENAEYMVRVRQSEEVVQRRDQIRRTIRDVERMMPSVETALGGSALVRTRWRKLERRSRAERTPSRHTRCRA